VTNNDSLDAIGEFPLIARIVERLGSAAADDILVPSGDDAAVWLDAAPGAPGVSGASVATIDALAEGTHWRPDTMSMSDVGWRAVAVNVSDLAAMGATPGYLLVAASLGPEITLDDLDGFVDGLADSCRAHGARIAGGDIVRGTATMFSVAAYGRVDLPSGSADDPPLLRRNAARIGDSVAVSGHPGASSAGLALIDAGRADDPAAAPLLAAHRRPHARTALGPAAAQAGIRCAIDVSDGVLQDLDHIAEQSGVGIELDCPSLPLHPAARTLLGDTASLDLALGGGEDFELLLVGPENTLGSLSTSELPVTVIGSVVAEHPGQTVAHDAQGAPYEPARRGWDQLAEDGAR
jgi:thiamine-monophosphate kinase